MSLLGVCAAILALWNGLAARAIAMVGNCGTGLEFILIPTFIEFAWILFALSLLHRLPAKGFAWQRLALLASVATWVVAMFGDGIAAQFIYN